MQISCAFDLFDCSEIRAADFRVLALVINIEQLACLTGIQKETAWTNELQCVPLGGVVTGCDRDATLRATMSYLKLDCWYRADADVDNAIAG